MKIWTTLALAALVQFAALTPLAADTPAPPVPAPSPAASPLPRPTATPAPRAEPSRQDQSQLFSVALVVADNEAAAQGGKLPPALEKAIADVRDFLPYRNFRLLDSGLIRNSRQGTVMLRGRSGEDFRASMVLYPLEDSPKKSYFFETFRLDVPPPKGAADQDGTPSRALQTALLASFRVDEGETVVVGSARLESLEGALIVLLTAVP